MCDEDGDDGNDDHDEDDNIDVDFRASIYVFI